MAEKSSSEKEKFRCRLCRFILFETEDISKIHRVSEKCNSWFLRDDEGMLPWVHKLIDEAGWTEGKLYCPKCSGRVGGFDFLHVVQCSCSNDVIPAIWCPRSKIDHVKRIHMNEEFKKVNHDMEINKAVDSNAISDLCKAGNNGCNMKDETEQNDSKGSNTGWSTTSQSLACSTQALCHSHLCCHSFQPCSDRFRVIRCTDNKHSGTADYSSGGLNPDSSDHYTQNDFDSKSHNAVPADFGAEMQQEFANIHQELKEMRQEVIHLTTITEETANGEGQRKVNSQDNENVQSAPETKPKRKRKNKPRRRCRGDWDNEPYFLENSRRRFNFVPDEYSQMSTISVSQKSTESSGMLELSDSEIPECYKCSVCLSLLLEPYKTPCGHVFCGLCLRHLNFATSGRPKCPLCREPVWTVENEKDIEEEIKVNFPANYRRRAKEERKNKHRKSPLPSTLNFNNGQREQSMLMNIINYISIVAMIISIIINSLIVNANRLDPVVRRNLITKIVYLVIATIGCVAMVVIGILLLIFAVDFFKIALFIVVSYVGLSRLILSTMAD